MNVLCILRLEFVVKWNFGVVRIRMMVRREWGWFYCGGEKVILNLMIEVIVSNILVIFLFVKKKGFYYKVVGNYVFVMLLDMGG